MNADLLLSDAHNILLVGSKDFSFETYEVLCILLKLKDPTEKYE